MLNEDKIRLMTRLSVYEEKTGRKDLEMNGYYHTDYIGVKVRKAVVSVTIAYALVLVMVGVYYAETLLGQLVGMDYAALGWKLLMIYLAVLIVYVALVIITTQLQCRRAKKRMNGYLKDFRHLRKHYERMEENE